MDRHTKSRRFSRVAAVVILTALVNSGAVHAASGKSGSCLSNPSEKCVLDILARQGSLTDKMAMMLALAGRAHEAKAAAAQLTPQTRQSVEAIGFARAGDLNRSLAVAGKIKTEARGAALGNIALVLARRGEIDNALGIANKISSTETKAVFLWRIARVMAVTGKTDRLWNTIKRAVRADPDTEKLVWPVLLALARRDQSNMVADIISRGRGDGRAWSFLIIEDAIEMLIAYGKKDAARQILAAVKQRLGAEKGRNRKDLLDLIVRSYAAMRDSRALRAFYRRYKKQIEPGFLMIQIARAGDSAFALAALVVASRGIKSADSRNRKLGQMYIRQLRVLVAIGIYASGDRRGAQKMSSLIDASLPSSGSKAWNEDILFLRSKLLAGTGRVGDALKLAEAEKLSAFSRKQALGWNVLPAVAASQNTAGMVRFLNYLARTRALRINDTYGYHHFCDAIARTWWTSQIDKSRALAAALLRASLADKKSTDWDHNGIAKCQLRAGDFGGAIETVRAIKDRKVRQTILLDILRFHLGS